MADLISLIRDLEEAKEGSPELDARIQALEYGEEVDSVEGHHSLDELSVVWSSKTGKRFTCWRNKAYTRSVDAALTLVPARGDDGLLWRIFLEQKPLHSGPSWIAIVREHAKDGGDAIGYTAPLAICTAALKARSASRDARPEKTAEAAASDTPGESHVL